MRHSLTVAALFFAPLLATGQQTGRTLTDADYARAEKTMSYNLTGLVTHTVAGVEYLTDGRIFYRESLGAEGTAYMLADPARGTKAAAFSNATLAESLHKASPAYAADPRRLSISDYKPDATGFTVIARGGTFHCNADGSACTAVPAPARPAAQPAAGQPATGQPATGQKTAAPRPAGRSKAPFDVSPDKKSSVFIRDWNLWLRTEATGEERQLTTDGVQDFGYATDNAGWQHSDAPIVAWSPDSTKIATFQQDERGVALQVLVPVTNRHPVPEVWHYPFLGDANVVMITRVIIDLPTGTVTKLKVPPDFHRSTLCDDVSCRGGAGWDDVQFAPDGKHLAYVSSSRDHKDAWLKVADTTTGEVREVFHEHAKTYYESGIGKVNWKYLPESNEFLWFSQRSDWGQMYLHDLTTGKLKNDVTHGEGTVTQVLRVDSKARMIYFLATGKEKGSDPYFTHFYRASFDGKQQQLLTPENADHAVTPSPDGMSFVDTYSTVGTAPVTVVRDNSGKVLVTLATANIAPLEATGWQAPEAIIVPARDGKTQLYGFLWKPAGLDPSKKYPLIDYVYPGPFQGSCGPRSFHDSERDNGALASLGFAVVCIDGLGTPFRSKTFQDAHADTPEGLGEDTIPDQVSGIKALGAKYSWIDMDRIGIWGHSGGGNATASAMFHFPDFFKVGISESGNHDSRDYEDDWDEKYGGLEKFDAKGVSNYEPQANQNFVANLKGKLLLIHGTMDDNVPPNNTLVVVDALMKANKNFDLIMVPNAHHGYGEASQYIMRRRWDYFVQNLAGNTPPLNYRMKSFGEIMRAMSAGPSDELPSDELSGEDDSF